MTLQTDRVGRRAGVVGLWTLVSRITGFLRDAAIAFSFGTGMIADAFFVAFRIPNLLRRLSAEGSLTVAFIPVFSKTLHESRDEAKKVLSATGTLITAALVVVTAVGIIAAPWLVRITAYGFTADPDKFAVTVWLTRWIFPFILLVSLTALAMGVLNSIGHFWASAAAPVCLNVGIILGAVGLARWVDPPALGLALGVLGGGLLQLALPTVAMIRRGFIPRVSFAARHPAVRQIMRMMIPAAYGSAVYQFNMLIMTFLASFLASGSVSYLWYADRIMEFPVGIFGISIATAILPTLAALAASEQAVGLKETFRYGLRLATFVCLPAMVGLFVLADPLVELLFRRGTFIEESVRPTAWALRCFALGLPCIAAVRIASTVFYALHDTKTPVRAANLSLGVTLVASLLLMGPLKHNGLALAVSLGAATNLIVQGLFLRKKIGLLGLKALVGPFVKMLGASMAMGAILFASLPLTAHKGVVLAFVAAGVGIYLGTARLLKIGELGEFRALLKKGGV